MDKASVFGTDDGGSIPLKGTRKEKSSELLMRVRISPSAQSFDFNPIICYIVSRTFQDKEGGP